jgi:hypothetical protein
MKYSFVFKGFLVAVLIGILVGIGVVAYQAGLAQGLASIAPAVNGAQPVYSYGWMPFMHPFGLGIFGLLFGLFLLFAFFGVVRRLIWGGSGMHRMMHHGPWGMHRDMQEGSDPSKFVPSMFSEWHRRAHEGQTMPPSDTPPPAK